MERNSSRFELQQYYYYDIEQSKDQFSLLCPYQILFIERMISTTVSLSLSKLLISLYFPLRRLFSTNALTSRFRRGLGPAVAASSLEGFDFGASAPAGGSADLSLNRRPVIRLGSDGSAAFAAVGTGSFPRLSRDLAAAGFGGLTAGVFALSQSIHLGP